MDNQEKPGSILDVLKGEQSVKMEHVFGLDAQFIVIVTATILSSMIAIAVVKKIFGD